MSSFEQNIMKHEKKLETFPHKEKGANRYWLEEGPDVWFKSKISARQYKYSERTKGIVFKEAKEAGMTMCHQTIKSSGETT